MIERIIELAIGNRLVVILLAVLVAAAGVYALAHTPIDAIPDLSENQVLVFADWKGKSPREIEDQVTYPLSVNLQGLAGVKSVRATSEFGFAMVAAIFDDSIDPYFARARVLERLSVAATFLPPGVVPYLAPDATALGQIFWYTVEDDPAALPDGGGHDLGELRAIQDWFVRYQLNSVEGVAEVASAGGFVRAWQVDVDPRRLRTYGVTLGEVAAAVGRANGAAGGDVVFEASGAELLIRGTGWVRALADLETALVAERDGVPVLVRHVAEVALGPEPRRSMLEKDGREAVGGVVVMRAGQNPLAVTERLKAKIESLAPGLPPGVRIVPFYERTRLVRAAIGTLRDTLLAEMAVAAVMVVLILGHIRASCVILVTLPLAALISFIFMYLLGVPSNIMSLSGIAISIGVLDDAGIVMTENAYARLHQAFGDRPVAGDTRALVLESCKVVGRPLFFSILIMVISFLPVFALSGMEGRMFRPLAYTKTFALLGVAAIAITVVPALLPTFLRGRLKPEESGWLVRSVRDVYRPTLEFLLDRPAVVAAGFGVLLGLGALLAPRLGREFMPPLDEGAIMDMPVTIPSASVARAADDIVVRDALLRSFPEVELVVGKVGRAETPTDPAPVDMVETIVNLRPVEDWPRRALDGVAAPPGFDDDLRALALERTRAGAGRAAIDRALEERAQLLLAARDPPYLRRKTKAELVAEMDAHVRMPGWGNIWTQPIVNRVDMLATGVRTMVGVKVFGDDLDLIQGKANEIAALLKTIPGAADVVADQIVGEAYLEIVPDRARAARYGVDVAAIQDAIEAALGGRRVATTVEGRGRFPLRVRYPRAWRDDEERIGRVLVGGEPGGAPPVPLALVADIRRASGPSMIKSENGLLRAYVQLNVRGRDLAGFAAEADRAIRAGVRFPRGMYHEMAGQLEHELRARRTLAVVVPAVLSLILLILYLTYGDWADALLIVPAVLGAGAGGVIFQSLFGFNFSVAVAVGYIACFGLAAETGIVMLVYLREAIERRGGLAALGSLDDLRAAVIEGAVQRLRPKLLTEGTTILGIVPMLLATGTGAEIMRPMAAPVLGGLLVADEVIDLFLPVLFYRVRKARFERLQGAKP